jgi:hypothetical protein
MDTKRLDARSFQLPYLEDPVEVYFRRVQFQAACPTNPRDCMEKM